MSLVFSIAALALFGLSYFLVRGTSAYTRKGGDVYVRRQKRKIIGVTLLFPALLLTALAVGTYVGLNPGSLPPPEAIATEPYVPPVLPKPSDDDLLASREAPMKFSTSGTAAHRRPSDDIPALSVAALSSAPASPPADVPAALPGNTASATDLPPIAPSPAPPPPEPTKDETDMDKLNAMLKTDPNNAKVYGELGNLYAARKAWTEAEANYEKSLALDRTNSPVKYNLAQMQFVQKKYDAARTGFAAMEKDMELGDLALYKTFLCDLYGGHQEAAAKELDAFNQAGENASYYFANVAWSLYQKKPDDARDWLTSASHIYSTQKLNLYTGDLVQLGYLPLPAEQ